MNFLTSVRRVAVFTLLIFAAFSTAAAQPESIYRLAAGTRITLKLDAEINSQVSGVNDTFIATLARPVIVRDTVVLPAGTTVAGLTAVTRPSTVVPAEKVAGSNWRSRRSGWAAISSERSMPSS